MKTPLSTIAIITGLLLLSISANAGDTITTASGIKYIQISQGNGVHPVSKQKVKIVYSLKSSNGKYIESNELCKPFEFRVGANKVIPGLDEIVKKMSKREEGYCILPSQLGHGEKGVKGIDPNSTLHLYIQIISIE